MSAMIRVMAALALSSASAAVDAASFEQQAADAAAQQLAAVTVYVDADWGNRTRGMAKALNEAHAAFARQRYRLVDVTAYNENGDLVGVFVSYRRDEAATR